MEKIKLGKSRLLVPPIALGCMRLAGAERKQADAFLHTALELELNFFDHADIYGGGACERVFGEMIKDAGVRREDLIIQSKCAIVPGKMYDFSKEHILSAVDGSLKRLGTDYLDVLLLHRPDALMEPEEVAEAFDELEKSGKVRHFGVSNEDPYTMELLQSALHQPICANQLQMSLTNATMIAQPMNTNICDGLNPVLDNGVLNYCRLHNITIQTWSPFQYGFFEGVFIGRDKYPELNHCLEEIADKYRTTPTTIAAAWILRHPAHMQLIAGTTKPSRFREICAACDITLTREEWYRLYLAAGHILP